MHVHAGLLFVKYDWWRVVSALKDVARLGFNTLVDVMLEETCGRDPVEGASNPHAFGHSVSAILCLWVRVGVT